MTAWQDIETIKDSPLISHDDSCDTWWHPRVLLWIDDQYGGQALVAQMDADTWIAPDVDRTFCGIDTDKITHWMPLPEPPPNHRSQSI